MKKRRDWSRIFCCGCAINVTARLTEGKEIYPHRPDLASLPFWKCDVCGNHVGCHHKTKDRTRPLGVIPTPEIKKARQHIHRVLDPLWKEGPWSRGQLYARLSKVAGFPYHTAELRSVEDGRTIYKAVMQIKKEQPSGAKP